MKTETTDFRSKLVPERLYNFPAGGFCGVFVPENVMKILAKANSEYSAEVRRILTEHKSEIHAADWTLANKIDGDRIVKQVTIDYIDEREPEKIERRIALFQAPKPKYQPEVFRVRDRDEAKEVAEAKLREALEE